jgi:metal-dependent amidase/aminoacylase/carboxypeptidase family protein
LEACGSGGPLRPDFAMVTVTHAAMGARAFGVAPSHAEILATLRTVGDEGMAGLCEKVEALAHAAAGRHELDCKIAYEDVFLACVNDSQAAALLRVGLDRAGLRLRAMPEPQRGSEDFGRFGAGARSAMLLLGAGVDCPPVHTPTYDFPDALIAPGARLFAETLAACFEQHA